MSRYENWNEDFGNSYHDDENHDMNLSTKRERVHNLNPGPAVLPNEVLDTLYREFYHYKGTGTSCMELSHRSKSIMSLYEETTQTMTDLFDIPASHAVLYMHGGATGQMAAVPLNMGGCGWDPGLYATTGHWSKKAMEECESLGVPCLSTSSPNPNSLETVWKHTGQEKKPSFVYHVNNETLQGLEYRQDPYLTHKQEHFPYMQRWVMDCTSNLGTKPIVVGNYDVIFAATSKNLGIAGIAVSIVRKATAENPPANPCPSILNYNLTMKNKSLLNTPPVYQMRVFNLCLDLIKKKGGLTAENDRCIKRSNALYDYINSSDGFYTSSVEIEDRSRTNIVFKCTGTCLDGKLVEYSEKQGILGLKGHRTVGGLRANLYVGCDEEDVEALLTVLEDFKNSNPI